MSLEGGDLCCPQLLQVSSWDGNSTPGRAVCHSYLQALD